MSIEKQLLINAIKLVEFSGRSIIPTAVGYHGENVLIGEKLHSANEEETKVFDNFKLELGGVDPRTRDREQFRVGAAGWRSSVGLTKDFVEALLKDLRIWLQAENLRNTPRILVAEPISMGDADEVSENWLKNYRYHLRKILEGQSKFQRVEFLPEPFAVFQYYRYGVRHPLLVEQRRHTALVIDFGGGTFDVSVIETTAKGDIGLGGRNSRPLSATSIPIGGAYLNRVIARRLLLSNLGKKVDRGRVNHALRLFEESVHGRRDLSKEPDDVQNFESHFRKLLRDIEIRKLQLSRRISDWGLDAEFPVNLSTSVVVPLNPLQRTSESIEVRFSASELRRIFRDEIWTRRLRPAICTAIDRARESLHGETIHVVLLSGGSANLRWIKYLIEEDLGDKLEDASVLELQENFQEIVAKGLAIECARRSYRDRQEDREGDFGSVTYNPLNLYLAPNDSSREAPRFKPVSEDLPTPSEPGELLPSASVLEGYIDRPISWKFRLSQAPTVLLHYYFVRGKWEGDEYKAYNIGNRIAMPRDAKFGAGLWAEITVREDGTTFPRFVYRREGLAGTEKSVEGEPFVLDITSSSGREPVDAYLGFDFGSTSSSLSFVAMSDVATFAQRGQEKGWLDLGALLPHLPYPVSYACQKFLAETRSEMLASRGLEAIEAALMYIAYVTYSELRAIGDRKDTKFFKSFPHCSAGPLWRLFADSHKRLGSRAKFAREFDVLLSSENRELIDKALSQVANFKHRKPSGVDYTRVLTVVGNSIRRSLRDRIFGGFEDIYKIQFRSDFAGNFRAAHGPIHPSANVLIYEGKEAFSAEELYLIDLPSQTGISLSPLMLWHRSGGGEEMESVDLFFFDKVSTTENLIEFKSTSCVGVLSVVPEGRLGALFGEIERLRERDWPARPFEGLGLKVKD